MVNKKICDIFERYKDRMDSYYGFLEPDEYDKKEFLKAFSEDKATRNQKLLSYRSVPNSNGDEMAYAITDVSLYYSMGIFGSHNIIHLSHEWKDVEKVMVDKDGINFIGGELHLPQVIIEPTDLCDEDLVESEDDFDLFIEMLNEMANAAKQAIRETDDYSDDTTLVNVTITGYERGKKIQLVNAVRNAIKISLKDSKELMDNLPSVICRNISSQKAQKIKQELEEFGATVQIKVIDAPKTENSKKKADTKRDSGETEQTVQNSQRNKTKTIKNEGQNSSFDDNYEVNVTEKNLSEVLTAGKSGTVSTGIDLAAVSKLRDKEEDLETIRKRALKPSEIGDTSKISSLKEKLSKDLKELEAIQKQQAEAKKKWEEEAYPVFVAATYANTRIVLGCNGYDITPANKGQSLPGVYTSTVPAIGVLKLEHLPEDVAQDLKSKVQSLSEKWIEYLAKNTEVWKKVADITGKKTTDPNTLVDTVVKAEQDSLNSAYSQAQKYEAWSKEINTLESEVETLRRRKDAVMKKLNEIDPILTAFSLPAGKNIYTQEWIENVKNAASGRKAMPYLPLYWNDKTFGTVFNWQKAIEDGKPNLFIEAATDEGDYGRVDMLDNFIATMLLAFPVKDLHFTVIEQNIANTFVTKQLPKKLCDCYNVDKDSESINLVANRLKEMLRDNRSSSTSGLAPREIVVFVGFMKRDQKIIQVMDKFRELIEKGKLAGIYFAIVLDEDITKYDWNGDDANRFEQFFTPYSTILTDRKDNDGNPIPDYDMLKSKAEYETEDGHKKGTLADLVINYLQVESSSVPNKVYELIESGKMYTDKLITDLDSQPRKDVGKLVIPIADNGEGDGIEMVMDDKDHMFYFILGMTGSGKSFTLHTILTNMMLKYDPSILDVVIMDFKGGVEMADYRGVPHVSSILANGADVQVAGEMLMSLQKEMKRRDLLFTKSGTKDISEYNRYAIRNGQEQMKNIIFLVDECQDLFKIDRPINSSEFIAMLAKKGRIYGIHMILATQTLNNSGIPKDALSQFSDFIFMKCAPDDVAKCGITDRELQKQVATLNKGEMYYCHGHSKPMHGFVYNYAGKGNVYKDKTLENLKSKRFKRPAKEQFYFDSQQIFHLEDAEIKGMVSKAKSGLKTTPTAILGKNLSVNLDTLYTKLGKGDGSNLLIVGANDKLQGERVLWNAVQSLYDCNKAIGQAARYYILPNIPEDVDAEAIETHEKRLRVIESLCRHSEVTLVDEDERADTIERVAATVRGRIQLAETDRKAIDRLDSIYLIIPNQQMFAKNMARSPKGLESLDSGLNLQATEQLSAVGMPSSIAPESDGLGFEGLNMPGSETMSPGFASIDFGNFATQAKSTSALQVGKPGRDYDEELRYILENGPSVNVHVLLQTTAPDKIYSGDAMREKEMGMLFNDIVLLKMLQASTMSLPVDSRLVENLSAEPVSLRAIAYNGEREPRTIVPFDFK